MDYAPPTALEKDTLTPDPISVKASVPVAADLGTVDQEEDLVADVRATLTPAQMVERKLLSLLKSSPLPVSHLMTGNRSSRQR
jgi:hypothetical protein